MRAAAENEPTYWLVYFGANDIDATMSKASELGGNALLGPMDIGVGKIGVAPGSPGRGVRRCTPETSTTEPA